MTEREIHVAVKMPENRFVHAVLLEKAGKFGRLQFQPHRRIMYHSDDNVAFAPYLIYFRKTQSETLGFAPVKLFVPFGIVRAARASPAARTADYNVSEFNAVVLQKIKTVVGSGAPKLRYPVPPIVVISAYKDFSAFKRL